MKTARLHVSTLTGGFSLLQETTPSILIDAVFFFWRFYGSLKSKIQEHKRILKK